MPMNRVHFQQGLSLPEFMQRFGTEGQCSAALEAARWLSMPELWPRRAWRPQEWLAQDLSVLLLPTPDFADCRYGVPKHPPAADDLVSGHLSDQPGQDGLVRARPEAATGRQLSHCLAHPP